jgi:hypothetical protein
VTPQHVGLSIMRDADSWVTPDVIDNFLATQLDRGALAIVLGAGVSMPFGLPSWSELVARVGARVAVTATPTDGLDEQAETIFNASAKSPLDFAETIRECLYAGVDSSFGALLQSKLLAALGAISMPSRRGSVRTIVTFNFDDLLEKFLSYYGFSAEAVNGMPVWSSRADIRIFHPHGMLPSAKASAAEKPVIFTRADYDKIVGKSDNGWRTVLVDLMSSHTCLFIGSSGSDSNLTSMMAQVNERHSGRGQGHPFWGVRVADPGDIKGPVWKARGIVQRTLASYADLPEWLASICQRAASFY